MIAPLAQYANRTAVWTIPGSHVTAGRRIGLAGLEIGEIAQVTRHHELAQRVQVVARHRAVLLGGIVGGSVRVE